MIDDAEWSPPASYLILVDAADNRWAFEAGEVDRVRNAVQAYNQGGRRNDALLSLTMVEGTEMDILVSRIALYWVLSAEHVRRNLLREKDANERNRAIRADLGLPWEEG